MNLSCYAARSAGLVAWALVSASVICGLLVSTKSWSKRPGRGWVLDLHWFLGGLDVVFSAVHVPAFVADSYVHFGVAEVLVPFASGWRPTALAYRVVAAYLLVAVEVTSLLQRGLRRRLRRAVHHLSFPLWVLATVHLFAAGADGLARDLGTAACRAPSSCSASRYPGGVVSTVPNVLRERADRPWPRKGDAKDAAVMSALVVYESMFGNTETVARAIADGLASRMEVDLVEVGAAPVAIRDDVTLLVAGGPTHAFGLSRANTRKSAADQSHGPLVSRGIGLREWLDALAPGRAAVATFDTRVRHPRVPGSAARAAERRLGKLGFQAVVPAETFWVGGTPGPLLDGEADRARRWGERVAVAVAADSAASRAGAR